ncbi:MAG: hypothetical protein WAN44_05835 [Propionibacteriaceae bacterium]
MLLRRVGQPYRSDLIELGIGHDLAVPRVAAPHEIVGTAPDGVALAPGTGDNVAAGLGLGSAVGWVLSRWARAAPCSH